MDEHILSHYFINSSHNTYIIGDQVTGPVSYCGYMLHLNLFGNGCLEIDPVFVQDGDVAITHAYIPRTTINYIRLSEILMIVTSWCEQHYDTMRGPMILSFDNKTIKKKSDQDVVWNVLNKTLYDPIFEKKSWYYPYGSRVINGNNIKLSNLRGKILIKWDQCDALSDKSTCLRNTISDKSEISELEDAPTDEQSIEKIGSYSSGKGLIPPPEYKLQTDAQKVGKKTITIYKNPEKKRWIHFTKTNFPLLKEIVPDTVEGEMVSVQFSDKRLAVVNQTLIKNTRRNFVRVFPKGTELLSNNYPNVMGWQNGCQMIAINIQKQDRFYHINNEFFRDTSYRLKQPWLLYDIPYPRMYTLRLTLIFPNVQKIDYSKILIFRPPSYDKQVIPDASGTVTLFNVNPTIPIIYFVVGIPKKTNGVHALQEQSKSIMQSTKSIIQTTKSIIQRAYAFKGAREIPFEYNYDSKTNNIEYPTEKSGTINMTIFELKRGNFTDPAIEGKYPFCYRKKIYKYTDISKDEEAQGLNGVHPENKINSLDMTINYQWK